MRNLIYIFFSFSIALYSQNKKDDFYLEDQIYIGVSYNLMQNKPESVILKGFSNTIYGGFIKDLPINTKRNFGFGIGLGYQLSTFFHNMKITTTNNQTVFESFNDTDVYSSNKLVFHKIEVPLEIRWRTSTRTDYKFWRIYSGVKMEYVVYSKASFNLNEKQKTTNFNEVNKFQYGLTLSVGQGTWNAHFYYGLNKMFSNANYNNTDPIKIKNLKLGLIFYIL